MRRVVHYLMSCSALQKVFSYTSFVGPHKLLSNCPKCVLLQISVCFYTLCAIVRDRDTHTHTNTLTYALSVLCSSSHDTAQLWPIFWCNWHDWTAATVAVATTATTTATAAVMATYQSRSFVAKRCRDKFDNIFAYNNCELLPRRRTFTFYSPTEGRCVQWYFVYVVYMFYVLVDQSLGIISVEDTRQLWQQQNAAIMTYIKIICIVLHTNDKNNMHWNWL